MSQSTSRHDAYPFRVSTPRSLKEVYGDGSGAQIGHVQPCIIDGSCLPRCGLCLVNMVSIFPRRAQRGKAVEDLRWDTRIFSAGPKVYGAEVEERNARQAYRTRIERRARIAAAIMT
jgi:hypothetical protein